jgi:hypothetical protein
VETRKGLAFSPSGKIVWSTCHDQTGLALLRADVDPPRLEAIAGGSWADIEPTWIPGTQDLAIISDRGEQIAIWIIDRNGTSVARQLPTTGEGEIEPTSISISPDGRLVGFSTSARGVWVQPVDGSAPPTKILDVPDVGPVAFSKDGSKLYVEIPSTDTTPAHIGIVSVKGGALSPSGIPNGALSPAVSPVDGAIAYVALTPGPPGTATSGVPTIMKPGGTPAPLSRDLPDGQWRSVHFSLDGKHVLLLLADTDLYEVDRASGKVVMHYHAGADQVLGASLSGNEIIVSRATWQGDLWTASTHPQ